MWWPFGKKRKEGSKKPRFLLVLLDEDQVEELLSGKYEVRSPLFFDLEVGGYMHCQYIEPHTFPPDTPYILEKDVPKLAEEIDAKIRAKLNPGGGKTRHNEAAPAAAGEG